MEPQKINIKAVDEDLKGHYANFMQVSHNKEEFVLDFILACPPVGQLLARIITSPSHMKRIKAALEDNIKKYEETYKEEIREADGPKFNIGFSPN